MKKKLYKGPWKVLFIGLGGEGGGGGINFKSLTRGRLKH